MKTYVFMNEHIRDPHTDKPVIRVQRRGRGKDYYAVEIHGPSRVVHDPKGCPAIKTHTVRAWIETESNVYGIQHRDQVPR